MSKESDEAPPIDEAELCAKLNQLQLNNAKCDVVLNSGDVEKVERHRDKLKALIKAAEDKKTTIEERKFNQQIDIAEIATWGGQIDATIAEADKEIVWLNKSLKEAKMNEMAQEHEVKLEFERKKHEQELMFKQQALEATTAKSDT